MTALELITQTFPNLPDAKEDVSFSLDEVTNLMIQFAEFHSKKALEKAAEDAKIDKITGFTDDDSILNAYPSFLIK